MFELKVDYSYNKGEGKQRRLLEPTQATPNTTAEVCLEFENLDTGLALKGKKPITRIEIRKLIAEGLKKGDLTDDDVREILRTLIGGKQ